jgi:glycosyltransferase involved in cell wall biosynthesis
MNVLLVSIAFPPRRDPESLQVAKYCRYLKNDPRLSLRVVTARDPVLNMDNDPSLVHYAEGIRVEHRLPVYENRYTNYLIRKISANALRYPDSKFTFWWQASRALHKLHWPDVLYSRSYPLSSTLLAYRLKQYWKVPWVLHLSDPWASVSENSQSPAELRGRPRRWNASRELDCFRVAEAICLTSEKTVELYRSAYPMFAEKFHYFPNVYDDALVTPNPWKKKQKLTFVYTGGFAEFRSPVPLLEAIKKFWLSNTSALADEIQFLFTGEMARVNHAVFQSYGTIPIIKHLGILPYGEVVALQRQADVLINVDTDIRDPQQAVYFPSKLLDYMVAQRVILAITNPYSTTYEVVQDKLGQCFGFHEVDRLAQYFVRVLEKFKSQETAYFHPAVVPPEYSAKQNAEKLVSLFHRLTSGHSR